MKKYINTIYLLILVVVLTLAFLFFGCSPYKGMSKEDKKAMKERVEYNKTHKGVIR